MRPYENPSCLTDTQLADEIESITLALSAIPYRPSPLPLRLAALREEQARRAALAQVA